MTDLITSPADEYQILKPYAEGGMSKTFLVSSVRSLQQLILKQINLETVSDWKVIELFEREAEVLRHLDHPHIPRYIDYFVSDNHRRFNLVQTFIEGQTVQYYIDHQLPMSAGEYVRYFRQCLQILDYLHRLVPPVIHRDITPKNIILHEGQAYLVDFGSVKAVLQTAESRSGTVVGTFGYMPPEQLLGHADTGSDLYSLGMSFIALAAHEEPFRLVDDKSGQINIKDRLDYLPSSIRTLLEKMTEPVLSNRIRHAGEAIKILDAPAPPEIEKPVPSAATENTENKTAEIALGVMGLMIVIIILIALFAIPKNRKTGDSVMVKSYSSSPDYVIDEQYGVNHFAFHPKDSLLAVAARDGVRIWNWNRAVSLKKLLRNKNKNRGAIIDFDPVESVLWSDNGNRLYAVSEISHEFTAWDTMRWGNPETVNYPYGTFLNMNIVDSIWYVAVYQSADSSVHMCRKEKNKSVLFKQLVTGPVSSFDMNINKKLPAYTPRYDSAAVLSFLESRTLIQKIATDTIAEQTGISPDGNFWVTSTTKTLYIWNIPLQRIQYKIPFKDYDSYKFNPPKIIFAIGPDSKRLAVFFKEWLQSSLYIYDLVTGREMRTIHVDNPMMIAVFGEDCLAFSPGGRWLGLYDNNRISIWKTDDEAK